MSENENQNEQPLRALLRQWTVTTPLPPRFQEQVWRRIARLETQPPPTLRESVARWLELALPRPKMALAYVAVLLVLGMTAGTLTAQLRSRHVEASLSARYVQALNPFQAAAAAPQP